jgi:hypothetical protein
MRSVGPICHNTHCVVLTLAATVLYHSTFCTSSRGGSSNCDAMLQRYDCRVQLLCISVADRQMLHVYTPTTTAAQCSGCLLLQAGALAAAAAAAAPAAPPADAAAAGASMPFLAWLKQQAAEQEAAAAAAAAAAAEARAAKRQRVSEAGASVASPAGGLHRHLQR